MNIANLSNDTLLDEVKALVGEEKKIIVRVIEYLKEIELRKLYLNGYSSMFNFATEFLGYSEAEAHVRIQAARLSQALPEVSSKIESGELTLSVAAAAQAQFRRENARRRSEDIKPMNREEKREALDLVTNCSRREAEEKLSTYFSGPSDLKRMEFLASRDLQEKLQHLMDYYSHQNFERDLGKLIELMADQRMKEIEKKYAPKVKRESTKHSIPNGLDAAAPASKSIKRSRFIPTDIKRAVWNEAEGQCCYTDSKTGKRCGSRHALEFDHIIAFCDGGESTAENLTLLCDAHNRLKSNCIDGSISKEPQAMNIRVIPGLKERSHPFGDCAEFSPG